MYSCVQPIDISDTQSVLDCVCAWADDNKMAINSKTTKDMWMNFGQTSEPPLFRIGSTTIKRFNHFKL